MSKIRFTTGNGETSTNGLAGRWILILLVGVLCIFVGCGVQDAAYVVSLGEDDRASGAAVGSEEPSDVKEDPKEPVLLYVYVCGAVARPGVAALPDGSRAADALEAAGGLTADAEPNYVNLAARVSDGEKLYFPTCQEAEQLAADESRAADGLVNINTADLDKLCTLPGIGASRAQDIIDYREANGAFQKAEDIMNVAGIKSAVYEKLRGRITV